MSEAFSLAPVLWQRFFDDNGETPLAGGKLYSYAAGTSTPIATYTDEGGGTPNTNPVVLDSSGYANIWLGSNAYKLVLEDADGNVLRTVDDVLSISQQIAEQIDLEGALAAANNLSDLESIPTALKNLGISPETYPTKFSVTSGQSATNLTGETVDGTIYSSVLYEFEVQQGTTIGSSGSFALQYLNAAWVLAMGPVLNAGSSMGVLFSVTQSTTISQLQAAEAGLGNGTIKLKKSYFAVTP